MRTCLLVFVLLYARPALGLDGGIGSDSSVVRFGPPSLRLPLPFENEKRLDASQLESSFFYHGLPYGSQRLVHPLRLILNGGFGILQLEGRDNRLFDIDYGNGVDNVWFNLRHPVAAIQEGGWRDFFIREILPISINSKSAHYWPNYTQHLIGGGMSYRMMLEWYRARDVPYARLWSLSTIAAYHVLNEVVENDKFDGYTTDPIADLYVFDPLGVLLFSSDRVARFFGRTLNMTDWSYQPGYDPVERRIENNGQNFALKYRVPWTERWSVFYHWGTHGELGLSRIVRGKDAFSIAAGFRAGKLVDLDEGVKTVDLVPTAGLFYDRDNSLLASLLLARSQDYIVRLNIYPGAAPLPLSPGIFAAVRQDNRFVAGITFGKLAFLPVGQATSF